MKMLHDFRLFTCIVVTIDIGNEKPFRRNIRAISLLKNCPPIITQILPPSSTKQETLVTRPARQARIVMMNLPLRRPSTGPPSPIILATPSFKHLASLSPPDKEDVVKVSQNIGSNPSPAFRFVKEWIVVLNCDTNP